MSFDAHEAFSFDSFFQQLLFWDDFEGDSLKDLWNTAGSGGGGSVVVDAETGGVLRFTTDGDDNDFWELNWNNIRSLLISKKVVMEFRLKLNQTDSVRADAFLTFGGNEYVEFVTGGGNWNIVCSSGAATSLSSGVALDTDYHIFRIETTPTSVAFFIDDVETANSPITTNITTEYLMPRFFIQTQEDATKSMDMDYVYIREER